MKTMFILVILLAMSILKLNASEPVGKVAVIKGNVQRMDSKGQKTLMKESSPVYQGDLLMSQENGSAKVVLKDMTELNLSGASELKIDQVSKDSPGLVSLQSGNLRMKVAKLDEKKNVKFLLRTKTATMGVRGTDFNCTFNNKTELTSIVTFEGAVAMAKTDASTPPAPQELVSTVTDTSKAVVVTEGQYSGVASAQEAPTLPVKISPAQLETLKTTTAAAATSTTAQATTVTAATTSSGKSYISPIPPGIDSKAMVPPTTDFQAMMIQSIGEPLPPPTGAGFGGPEAAFTAGYTPPPPEGFYDKSTGQFAPPAGGFVDLNTGQYIPPPPGSNFDPIAGVYVPPPNVGSFDARTGDYVPPKGMVLTDFGTFVAANAPPSEMGGNYPGGTGPGGPGGDSARTVAGDVRPPTGALPIVGMVDPKMMGDPSIMRGWVPPVGQGPTYNYGGTSGGAIAPPIFFTPPPGAIGATGIYTTTGGDQPLHPVYDQSCMPFCGYTGQTFYYAPPTTTTSTNATVNLKIQ